MTVTVTPELEALALRLWREREMTYPAYVRRLQPDDLDRSSGAWARMLFLAAGLDPDAEEAKLRKKANCPECLTAMRASVVSALAKPDEFAPGLPFPPVENGGPQAMSTRAKFTCRSIEDYGQSKKVNLGVVYEGELGPNEENKRFTRATPSGECWLTIDNPAASVQFVPGRSYYVTFEEAPADAWNKHAYE